LLRRSYRQDCVYAYPPRVGDLTYGIAPGKLWSSSTHLGLACQQIM